MHEVVAFFMGVLQGLTEFIPVSSSGHLVIAEYFVGATDHTFIQFIDIGTLAALLIYYRHELARILKGIKERKDYRLVRNVLLTSLPAGGAGLILSGIIDKNPFFTNIIVVAVALIAVGIVMVVLEKLPKASAVKNGAALPWQRALLIGFAQMCALIPGVSRSGSTIIAGRLSGLDPEHAADYSFLASIPIMLALMLKLFVHSEDRAYFFAHLPTIIISNIAAFVVGMAAIGLLLKYLRKNTLKVFGWYRIVLAVVVLVVVLLQLH